MPWIIDRCEEGFAILEDSETQEILEINRKDLPKGAREGQALKIENGQYLVDLEETARRKQMILEKFNKLRFKKKR